MSEFVKIFLSIKLKFFFIIKMTFLNILQNFDYALYVQMYVCKIEFHILNYDKINFNTDQSIYIILHNKNIYTT